MVARLAPTNSSTLLVKGILAGVLGIPIGGSTIGIHFSEGNKIRITLSYASGEYPKEDLLKYASQLIAETIEKDVPIYSGK